MPSRGRSSAVFRGAQARLRVGALRLEVTRISRPADAGSGRTTIDPWLAGLLGGALASIALTLAGAHWLRSPRRRDDPPAPARRAPSIARFTVEKKKPLPPPPAVKAAEVRHEDGGPTAARHAGAEGELGKRNAPKRDTRAAPKAVRKSDKEIAASSGLLKALGAAGGGLSTVLEGTALGGDVKGALGHLTGATVADARGTGMGLRGIGAGGGGEAATIGIGGVGTRGKGGGLGGYGTGKGALKGKGEAAIADLGNALALDGDYDRELVRQVVRAHRAQLRFCYEDELTRHPELEGKIAARWVITGTGAVAESSVADSTLGDAEVERCLVERIRTWTFPRPKAGGEVVVTYPFLFKPNG